MHTTSKIEEMARHYVDSEHTFLNTTIMAKLADFYRQDGLQLTRWLPSTLSRSLKGTQLLHLESASFNDQPGLFIASIHLECAEEKQSNYSCSRQSVQSED
jgi:hypothetical protein